MGEAQGPTVHIPGDGKEMVNGDLDVNRPGSSDAVGEDGLGTASSQGTAGGPLTQAGQDGVGAGAAQPVKDWSAPLVGAAGGWSPQVLQDPTSTTGRGTHHPGRAAHHATGRRQLYGVSPRDPNRKPTVRMPKIRAPPPITAAGWDANGAADLVMKMRRSSDPAPCMPSIVPRAGQSPTSAEARLRLARAPSDGCLLLPSLSGTSLCGGSLSGERVDTDDLEVAALRLDAELQARLHACGEAGGGY